MYIVDSSGSIGDANWPPIITFLKDLTNAFNVHQDWVRVGGILYSAGKVEILYHFTFHSLFRVYLNCFDIVDILDSQYSVKVWPSAAFCPILFLGVADDLVCEISSGEKKLARSIHSTDQKKITIKKKSLL